MTDHELVRPSRDGDQFHYHWAARHCLALLPGSGDLVAVAIEGASTSEGATSVEDGDELIDVGLYYGSEALEDARSIHYIQLKHSTRHAQEPWTASGLRKTLKGFAQRFSKLLQQIPTATLVEKLRFRFTSNRPIEQKVAEALEDLASASATRHPTIRKTLVRYTGLTASQAADFFKIFSAEGGEPSLWVQRNLLVQDVSIYLAGADSDSPVQLKEMVARKATSEFASDPAIRRHDVLRALKATETDLVPAPCLIVAPTDTIRREQEAEIRDALLSTRHPIVLHADGGVGKSILASRLAASMPSGSVAVLYDCFGDGLYRNALNFRHRHRDALVQIANELAAQGLCHPLIPSGHADAKGFMRAFFGRLKQAIDLLRAQNPQASLCLIIDAADNADMAAEEQGEAAFVRDLIRTAYPDGVRFAFTCRTHRRERLGAPTEAHHIELRPYTETETREFLQRTYPEATEKEAAEFAYLSSANPRVQALAVSQKLPIDHMLKELGPQPSTVDRAIGELLQRAIDKLKDQGGNTEARQIDLVCQGLAVLRPLVPISVLAQISGIPESAVRSFALDLGRPLLVKGNSLHFLDEPAETWFRERFKPAPENLESFLVRLRPLAKDSSYVASTLPQLLLSAGRMDELVELALSEEGLPTTNPLERRDVELQRLTFALKASLQSGRYAAAAKLALKGGGESAGEARQMSLIQDNTDIAALLLSPDRIDELVSRRTFGAAWMGSHHAYDAGLLSGRNEFLAEASSRLRMAMDWLQAWSQLTKEDREDEPVDDADRSELAMAFLRVEGPESAVKFLTKWRPRRLAFMASKLLARRLMDLGHYEQLDILARHATRNLWILLGLAVEAFRVGRCIPAEPMARLMRILSDSRVRLQDSTQWDDRWDALDAVTAAISLSLRTLPREDATWAGILRRHLPDKPPYVLWERFSSDRAPLLRAYALEAALRGESLPLLALAPPDIRKELETKETYGRSADTVAFERSTGGILPWFVLGAEILCGRTPSDLNKAFEHARKVSTQAASDDYQNLFGVRQIAAIEWTRLLRDASATTETFVDPLRAWISEKKYRLRPETLTAMCRIAAREKELSGFALELAVMALEPLETLRENAETRTDAYQQLARAVFTVSSSEASAYFNRAVEISSRIGDENLDRWSALLDLADACKQEGVTRPSTAYRLSRVAELTYEYVARDKHFDWQKTVDALVGLCTPSAFAIL
ncbi:NACHT domain-containing protein, partial [Burkholderia gladioli]|uniref:NACHT domain-containing protein n=1 Tax=Burkholderia gladioli TaxID=28095 RepID=UPI003F7AFE26